VAVTRTHLVLALALVLCAAFLPLAALPVVIFVVAAPLFAGYATARVTVIPRAAAALALAAPRAPPSR
jgi:hypothetical protein